MAFDSPHSPATPATVIQVLRFTLARLEEQSQLKPKTHP